MVHLNDIKEITLHAQLNEKAKLKMFTDQSVISHFKI